MSTITLYKIKDERSGFYMNKHGTWDKRGKTWETLGKLKQALQMAGYYTTSSHNMDINDEPLPSPEIKIIEIVIQETEANSTNLADLVAKERRYAKLSEKYGNSFGDLVERIESQGQTEQFQWCLATTTKWDYKTNSDQGGLNEMLGILKSMNLKHNKDYKKASTFNGGACFAFASKQSAMTVRLAMINNNVTSIDLVSCIETNLDDTQ